MLTVAFCFYQRCPPFTDLPCKTLYWLPFFIDAFLELRLQGPVSLSVKLTTITEDGSTRSLKREGLQAMGSF